MNGRRGGGGGGGQNYNGTNNNSLSSSSSSNNNNNNNNNNNKSNSKNGNAEEQKKEEIRKGARKMLQSVKEIVSNVSDSEIYAALNDSNMDPNEAVNRLLSQDPFHEVKSKREKKKEKDMAETRSRGVNNVVHRAGKCALDRYGRGVSCQYGSSESGVLHAKPVVRKENGTHAYTGSSSSSPDMTGSNINRQLLLHSDSVATENEISQTPANEVFSSTQISTAFQSAWSGVLGQVSMADVVKMGRPQNKGSSLTSHYGITSQHGQGSGSVAMDYGHNLPEYHVSNMSEIITEQEFTSNDNFHADDGWPSIEQPLAASVPSFLDVSGDTELYLDSSCLHLDGGHHQIQTQIEGVQSAEGHTETTTGNSIRPASVAGRNVQEDGSGVSSLFDDRLYTNSYHSHLHSLDHDSDEDGASRVAANLQHISLQNDDQRLAHEEANPSVIIPDHLQVHGQDCAHLSFGSFGAGINSAFSGPFSTNTLKNKLEETAQVVDGSAAGLLDARNPDYYGDGYHRSTLDENLMYGTGMSASTYDSISVHQPEVLKEEIPGPSHESEYVFSSSAPGYPNESTQQLNAAFIDTQTSSQMPNVVPFSSVMANSNSLPSSLLASTVQSGRESDLSFLPFHVTQSLATMYSNMASSISGPSTSMSEALRAASISSIQPAQQTPAGANVTTDPAIPQQLPMHPYSQPTLPLGPFANMIGYPFLPQSYAYVPSAFQQTFAGNSTYHQSLAAMLPQYKNSVSVSSLPQSAAVTSGHGLGSSNSVPGSNFPLSPPTAPTGTTLGYDDILSSQYKEGNHLISSLQQNENPAMWVHELGSRTISGVPGSMYYGLQGHNQQAAQFREAQQQLQQFVPPGYQDYYQTALLLEHQPQNSRDRSLLGSQGQPSKQSQQLWQSSY